MVHDAWEVLEALDQVACPCPCELVVVAFREVAFPLEASCPALEGVASACQGQEPLTWAWVQVRQQRVDEVYQLATKDFVLPAISQLQIRAVHPLHPS